MGNLAADRRRLAGRLAGGPAFLILGQRGYDGLGSVAVSHPWSGVYTSSTAHAAAEMFTADWRTSSSLGAMGRAPSRSTSDLEVRYLFGAEHLPEPERPPTTPVERASARMRSIQELTRLVTETLTPKGTLIIDGWEPGDPLDVLDLVPLLGLLGPQQVYLFSAKPWRDNAFISDLVGRGQLVLNDEKFETTISDLVDAGAVRGRDPEAESDHIIALGEGFANIDVHTWNQVRRSARPVDLELLTPAVFSSPAARYQEFRNFAGATEGVPRWRGLAAGMNLNRDFEQKVIAQVRHQLDSRELPTPIVVEGQTATGKSIGLASIAIELSRSGEVAVLHQARRTVRPAIEDIDMYAAWAEERGARATVLIWDGMCEPGDYDTFSRQLRARGRKVLIVGSSYKKRKKITSSLVIPASAALSDSETSRLIALLQSFGVEIRRPKRALDTSFLAFLYHTLPETERQLRSGLAKEMRAAEQGIAKLARDRGVNATSSQRLTAMQAAFQAAGVVLGDLLPPDQSQIPMKDQSFAERAPIQRVTTLVLVAGRHGIPVPIDLALRILGREGSQSVRDALQSSDIIREIDDDNGEIYLSARSHLEAELLSKQEVPLSVEIEVIAEAIRNVRVVDGFAGGADEVQFLVSLLERVGPAAEQPQYRPHFGDIAQALRERRESLPQPFPRLVLQESTFVRGYVQWQQGAKVGTTESRIAALEFNNELLNEVLHGGAVRGLMRLSLSVELASTLGSIIHEFALPGSSRPDSGLTGLASRLGDVLNAVLDARSVDPGNTYPVDVLAWSTRDAIATNALNPEERIEGLANAVATLESLDRTSLSEQQRAKLDRRGVQLRKLLADDAAVWEYLQNLEKNPHPAATYFLAQFEAEEGLNGEVRALSRLRKASPETRKDWRCAQLLVDLTWKEISGSRLLQGERVPLYLSETNLTQIEDLALDLADTQLPDLYRLRFIQAIAAFQALQFSTATSLFREVEDLTRQLSKRIYTSYLLADKSGKPRLFTGRVEFVDARSGSVWVNELGTRVKFVPRLFSATGDFARDQQLPAFFIGFKLSRGAVAEPRTLLRDGGRA
ncbi:hypothetical protein LJR013_002638 [Pseudarthrobacter oxydans]|uniref:hypothetical protein n=1 Tax=Pseudarthrobacter oxydans TaxID=1671 RepID=UPI003ED1104C